MSSSIMVGSTQAGRSNLIGMNPAYIPEANPGMHGGNTYTGTSSEPSLQEYENLFGPSGRDIKQDMQRFKRHGRWHLPDYLRGVNPWMTDRVDGLITDATNSPFTTTILPYLRKEDPDGKIKWNVWSFDEALASRVPYEAAARTLTQSKRSFAAYMVRHGLAIVLEHNFLASPAGVENFRNQLKQLIGSIQYTNDLDVHVALIMAPSYQRTMRERYYSSDKSASQICRSFVDLFGIMQKNANGLDFIIEEVKAVLRTWGADMPDFLLCPSPLTMQLTMTPEKTSYFANGPDGTRRLKQGPDLQSYRGINIIHTRSFAMESGQQPRDLLRRRVRTAEYYRITPNKDNENREFEFYNEERDCWFSLTFKDLLKYARIGGAGGKNQADVERALRSLQSSAAPGVAGGVTMAQLGALMPNERDFLHGALATVARGLLAAGYTNLGAAIMDIHPFSLTDERRGRKDLGWMFSALPFDLGVRHIEPSSMDMWREWTRLIQDHGAGFAGTGLDPSYRLSLYPWNGRLTQDMQAKLFNMIKHIPLVDMETPGTLHQPGTSEWFRHYTFYLSLYKRGGVPLDFFDDYAAALPAGGGRIDAYHVFSGMLRRQNVPSKNVVDISVQLLSPFGIGGSVNEGGNMLARAEHAAHVPLGLASMYDRFDTPIETVARKFVVTWDLLKVLFARYMFGGKPTTLLDILRNAGGGHGGFVDTPPGPGPNFVTAVNMIDANAGFIAGMSVPANTLLLDYLRRFVNENAALLTPLNETDAQIAATLAAAGIDTLPMTAISTTRADHPRNPVNNAGLKEALTASFGHLSLEALRTYGGNLGWGVPTPAAPVFAAGGGALTFDQHFPAFFRALGERFFLDGRAVYRYLNDFDGNDFAEEGQMWMEAGYAPIEDGHLAPLADHAAELDGRAPGDVTSRIARELDGVYIDMNGWDADPAIFARREERAPDPAVRMEDIEIVVVRPNIEHNMLGIIMGKGGSSLGNTLWGQTELSCYDDGVHGLWGMSYKYHARAIVFNEKNLVRLWDVAYDRYNGGKDDTWVDWTNPNAPNGYATFQGHTLDIGRPYQGPSMMVMAFVHDRHRVDENNVPLVEKHYVSNWPSPMPFYDTSTSSNPRDGDRPTLPVDSDNIEVVDISQFRVFNNDLYRDAYAEYRRLMPDFRELHLQRKGAGSCSVDSESPVDSLAFQGTMRIKKGGMLIQQINGSGHHGVDEVGMASVRAGKGNKASAAPIGRMTFVGAA